MGYESKIQMAGLENNTPCSAGNGFKYNGIKEKVEESVNAVSNSGTICITDIAIIYICEL